MKIFMIGGTGLLGSAGAELLLEKGHEVITLSLPDISKEFKLPEKMKVEFGNYMELSDDDIRKYMSGMDAFVFAAGIDDRVSGDYPIYDLYKKYNNDPLEKMIKIAKESGVKKVVVLGSYFSYFARKWKKLNLCVSPYIRSRIDQENMALSYADDNMTVSVLELPYIFGTQPGRKPVWTILCENILSMKNKTMYPKGGTTMVTVKQVGQGICGAVENGKSKAYPFGFYNMEWPEMLKNFHEAMGCPDKPIKTIPTWLIVMSAKGPYKKMRKNGKETGLNMINFYHAMSKNMFIDKTMIVNELGVTEDNIKDAIIESIKLSMESINGKEMIDMKI